MSQMTAVQVSGPGGAFAVVKLAVPEPGPVEKRVAVWIQDPSATVGETHGLDYASSEFSVADH